MYVKKIALSIGSAKNKKDEGQKNVGVRISQTLRDYHKTLPHTSTNNTTDNDEISLNAHKAKVESKKHNHTSSIINRILQNDISILENKNAISNTEKRAIDRQNRIEKKQREQVESIENDERVRSVLKERLNALPACKYF